MTRNDIIQQLRTISASDVTSLVTQICKAKKYQDLKSEIINSTNYLPTNCKFSERLFQIINGLKSRPLCNYCQEKVVNFRSFNMGYRQFCSSICINADYKIREKRQQTCLKKYGVDNPAKAKEFQDKSKETCLRRYAVTSPIQLDEFQEKRRQTCLEKYGVDSPMKLKKIQERRKRTCLEKYGVEYPTQIESK